MPSRRFGLALVLSLFASALTACGSDGTEVPPVADDTGSEGGDETAVDSAVDSTTEDTEVDSATEDTETDSGVDAESDTAIADAADAEVADDAADAADSADSADAADGATCTVAGDCPGTDTDCARRACTGGLCSITFTAAGTSLSAQTAGDCKTAQCDGSGGITQVADTADVPVDGNDCTDDVCTGTVPSNPAKSSGAACGTGGSKLCNGSGACVECLTASTCPGTDNECQARTCISNVCGINHTADGTAAATQVPGDCKQVVCNGSGGTRSVNLDSDIADDGNPCTTDACSGGTATHVPVTSGTSCGSGKTCNSAGVCVGCITAADCPGSDTECSTRTCTAGVCGVSNAPSGTVLTSQTAGDCKERQCNGSGGIVSVNADTDVPNDSNQCTNDVCTAGVPSNPPKTSGTSCSGGGICSGTGSCVQCLTKDDCAGSDTECSVRTCVANVCGLNNAAAGTVTSMQTAGDCKENQCDGSGNISSVNVSGDVTDDGNECTNDICTAGAASHPAKADGTSCGSGTGTCSAGTCVTSSLTMWISHVGDGSAALTSAATAAFLNKLEINVTTGAPTLTRNILAFPTAVSGSQRRLTLSGSAPTEGALALSGDGRYVTMAGYDAATATATVNTSTSATVNRVFARIDASLAIDTSTATATAFSGTNPRSVVTNDGTGFWGAAGVGGTHYFPFGGTTDTAVNTTPGNARWVTIFGGQLYVSSGATSYTGVSTIGTGLPTTTGQTATLLPGVSTTSPYGYALFDRDPAVAGLDTLYMADDSAVTAGGGVQKWTFNGSTWTKAATFTAYVSGTSTPTQSYRAVAGRVINNKVYLVAMATANAVLYIDDGSTVAPGTIVATANTNTAFRGVSVAPN